MHPSTGHHRERRLTTRRGVVSYVLTLGVSRIVKKTYCDFCFNSNVPLYEAVFEPTVQSCYHCAAQAVALTTPRSQPTPPPAPLSKEERLAVVPTPKSLVAHLD